MPRITHWIGQFLLAAGSMFALLTVVGLLRGEAFASTWPENLAWAATAAAIFIGGRYRQARKGAACAVCEKPDK
jgi:hypothetical protein